jgi:hypothetical protein
VSDLRKKRKETTVFTYKSLKKFPSKSDHVPKRFPNPFSARLEFISALMQPFWQFSTLPLFLKLKRHLVLPFLNPIFFTQSVISMPPPGRQREESQAARRRRRRIPQKERARS